MPILKFIINILNISINKTKVKSGQLGCPLESSIFDVQKAAKITECCAEGVLAVDSSLFLRSSPKIGHQLCLNSPDV